MCRNIKTLFNFEPPATDEEIRAASLQFVRKLSGFNAPSRANEAAFDEAISDVFAVARRLIDRLETNASPRNREEEAEKARQRAAHQKPRQGAGRTRDRAVPVRQGPGRDRHSGALGVARPLRRDPTRARRRLRDLCRQLAQPVSGDQGRVHDHAVRGCDHRRRAQLLRALRDADHL